MQLQARVSVRYDNNDDPIYYTQDYYALIGSMGIDPDIKGSEVLMVGSEFPIGEDIAVITEIKVSVLPESENNKYGVTIYRIGEDFDFNIKIDLRCRKKV